MKLNALRDFVTVVERGGLRAAARYLGQPQPALSRSIHELEKELGVTLFERHAKGVRLTPVGSVFLRRANAVRNELQRARDEIGQLRGETHGRVTLCMSTAPHLGFLPRVLQPFRACYPEVHLEIIDGVYPLVEASLLDGTVDCYIGPAPLVVPHELQVEKLFENTRVILGRKGHPLAHATTLRDLVDAEWITTSITHRAEEELGPLFDKHGLPAPRLAMRAQSALTFMTALANSDLLMMVPIQWIEYPLLSKAFQEIKVVEALPAPPICIVQRIGLPLTPAAEHFCTLVRRISG
ncbi:LysR substrate-binding domain-containing protein [Caballeronia sp. LZ035]|uniref:LysR substrate-binding domain-containing protein n=1 Tax=Caballeronia sp. LZ035 TaxID=3038568 RepID=UPI0028567009|nr:LysR substrate-binding domain-containing protein [Caballeronia sp. LZ035]MDR5756330.1 LysR substrate-binding domain-containing protein [Caballeronia sp. LZ035]